MGETFDTKENSISLVDATHEVSSNEIVKMEFREVFELPEHTSVYRFGDGMRFFAINQNGKRFFLELFNEKADKTTSEISSKIKSWEGNREVFGFIAFLFGGAAFLTSLGLFFMEKNLFGAFQTFLVFLILMVPYLVITPLKFKSLRKKKKHSLLNENRQLFEVSKNLLEVLSSLNKEVANENTRAGVNKLLGLKLEAGQPDEEIIAWAKSVIGIIQGDKNYPVDLTPVDSVDSVKISKKIESMQNKLSFENREIQLVKARELTAQLKMDSSAVGEGAKMYLSGYDDEDE